MRFSKYFNNKSGRNNIYSYRNMLGMSLEELLDKEDELVYQNNTIGIPDDEELEASEFVEPFVSENGAQSWRSRSLPTTAPTGFASDVKLDNTNPKPIEGSTKLLTQEKNNVLDNYSTGKTFELNVQKNQEKNDDNTNVNSTANENVASNTQNIPENIKNDIPSQIEEPKKQKNIYEKYQGLTKSEALQKVASKIPGIPLDGEYYSIATHLADGEEISENMKNQNFFYTLKDVKNSEMKAMYKKQIAKMFNIDENDPIYQEKINNAQIVSPKTTSELHNMVKDSKEMQEWIAKNFERIQKNGAGADESVAFNRGENPIFEKDRALYSTIHRAALDNIKVNPEGSLSIRLNDPYNFERWTKNENDTPKFFVDTNNRAYEQQEKGQLENYLLSLPLYYSKEEIEEILKRMK